MYHTGQNSNPNLWDQRPQKIPRYPDPDRKKRDEYPWTCWLRERLSKQNTISIGINIYN